MLLATAACCASFATQAATSAEAQSVEELRNTVVNILQALVDRGVVTREQAETLVRDAQNKASASAAAIAQQAKAEEGAVRVPYVPETVREEIRKEVAAELAPEVTAQVVEQAKVEGWGVPAALPDWVNRIRWSGDMRLRGQADLFASRNEPNTYFDYSAINQAGGIDRAGPDALLNTTEDRERLRARLRFGFDAQLGAGWSVGARLSTGNLAEPVSTNQTLGNYGRRYQTAADLAYLSWKGASASRRHQFEASAGRIDNPWLSTDLVWDTDLTFEGVAGNYRFGFDADEPGSHVFLTLGAFPLQEVERSSKDKWLYGSQLGVEWVFGGGHRLTFAAAYYDYQNIVGQRNTLDSTLLDYTAPEFMQKGNTMFDIRSDADPTTNLFALAADYKQVNGTLKAELQLAERMRFDFVADYVKNVGFDQAEIQARAPELGIVGARDQGYRAEIGLGSRTFDYGGAWRATLGYRYLERDAVLDAFTDSDFHLGGTDAKGYYAGFDYSFAPRVYLRFRYLSADAIDGPPLGIDVMQLDLNARF